MDALATDSIATLDATQRHALELIAQAAGLLATRHDRADGPDGWGRTDVPAGPAGREADDLLAAMIRGGRGGECWETSDLCDRLRASELVPARLNAVVVASPVTAALDAAWRAMAADHQGLAGCHQGLCVAVLHARDPAAAADEARDRAAEYHGHYHGHGETPARPVMVCGGESAGMRWPRAFAVAARCSQLLRQLGVAEGAVMADQIDPLVLLLDAGPASGLRLFFDRTLGPLLAYDARRGTDLVGTVAAYFDQTSSNAQTAKALHVHLNTLLKRLARVESILGPGWRTPERAVGLQLAIRLWRAQRLAATPRTVTPRTAAPRAVAPSRAVATRAVSSPRT